MFLLLVVDSISTYVHIYITYVHTDFPGDCWRLLRITNVAFESGNLSVD